MIWYRGWEIISFSNAFMNVDEFTTSHPAEKDEHVIAVKSSLHYNTWYDRGKVIKIYYTSLDEKLFTIQPN